VARPSFPGAGGRRPAVNSVSHAACSALRAGVEHVLQVGVAGIDSSGEVGSLHKGLHHRGNDLVRGVSGSPVLHVKRRDLSDRSRLAKPDMTWLPAYAARTLACALPCPGALLPGGPGAQVLVPRAALACAFPCPGALVPRAALACASPCPGEVPGRYVGGWPGGWSRPSAGSATTPGPPARADTPEGPAG